jgi:hypothetical protein
MTLRERVADGAFWLGAGVTAGIEEDPQGTEGMLWACIHDGSGDFIGEALLPESVSVEDIEALLAGDADAIWPGIRAMGGTDLR